VRILARAAFISPSPRFHRTDVDGFSDALLEARQSRVAGLDVILVQDREQAVDTGGSTQQAQRLTAGVPYLLGLESFAQVIGEPPATSPPAAQARPGSRQCGMTDGMTGLPLQDRRIIVCLPIPSEGSSQLAAHGVRDA
jgi:hypothetical protein